MNDTRIFRNINKIEINIIANSARKISTKLLPVLDTLNRFLYILINKSPTEKIFPKIYLITNEQQKVIEECNITKKIYSAGLYFGFIKKGIFYFSIEGVEYLYKQKLLSEIQRLQVNELGEKSILYGNNILKNMVITHPERLKENDFLLIFNELGEIIAIAQSRVNHKSLQELPSKEIVAFNLSDKGFYLRRKQ